MAAQTPARIVADCPITMTIETIRSNRNRHAFRDTINPVVAAHLRPPINQPRTTHSAGFDTIPASQRGTGRLLAGLLMALAPTWLDVRKS